MAITRRSAAAIAKVEILTPPHSQNNDSVQKEQVELSQSQPLIAEAPTSFYEQVREQRIKENRERLQKLGVLDLSLLLKASTPAKPPKRPYRKKTPSSLPPRRSFRLNGTPVSGTNAYTFVCIEPRPRKRRAPPRRNDESNGEENRRLSHTELKKMKKKPKKKSSRGVSWKKKASEGKDRGPRAEVYTEEHEKLLGDTDREWMLCVDGYGSHGSRIYDPINGKTCHQCRQKTLGLRTQCCICNLVQGQFCGDCLYMRYGEHVVEANQNPNWICPPCRGICNCSLCRQARGWLPTGNLYRKVTNLGFKSVAHYLIMTKRTPSDAFETAKKPQTAKRSLPFGAMEVPSDNESKQELNIERN